VSVGQINNITFFQLANSVNDIDGNLYHTVIIGNQEWTVENLRATHFNDGTPIPKVTDGAVWTQQTTGAMCAYQNNEGNVETYGYLYNGFCTSSGKLAPVNGGWRVPTSADWATLVDYIGGSADAGLKLKATFSWANGGNGNDVYGFKAFGGGYRYSMTGAFSNQGLYGYWWSSTKYAMNGSYNLILFKHQNESQINGNDKRDGYSVRFVRDL